MTGRLCRPFTDLMLVQWPEQVRLYRGSHRRRTAAVTSRRRLVLVLVGTDHHPFDRLVGWSDAWAREHPDVAVVVQYGHVACTRGGEGHAFLAPAT